MRKNLRNNHLMKFSFGRNWLSYSQSALDQDKVERAREAFGALTSGIELRAARFLDIGFGQGLPLFLAAEAGADVHGIDLDPMCAKAVEATQRFFPGLPVPKIAIASILDDSFVRIQRERAVTTSSIPGGCFTIRARWTVRFEMRRRW